MPEALPSSVTLLETIRTFLEREIIPQVDARSAYLLKVTGNVLDILARESVSAADASVRERERLLALLGVEDAAGADVSALNRVLCERIAKGEQDLSSEVFWQHLLRTTRDRLAIDNPRYKYSSS